MKDLYIEDRQAYGVSHREYTDEGYLRVPARVAKTGIQQYLRKELGLDGDPNAIVNVYRPEDQVFDEESLSTYSLADVTYLHPNKLVNAESYKSVVAGVVATPGRRDGDFVVADLLIKDAETIKKIESGVAEVSAGYTATYDQEEGVAPCGTPYQYVQRGIKINHVAIVPLARAGRQARIFDNKPKGKTMHKVTLDSGRSVEIQDDAVAQLVTDSVERLQKQVSEANSQLQAKQAVVDAQAEEITKLKADSSEDKIQARVAEIAKVTSDAKVIKSDYVTDSLDPVEIQRGVLAAVSPNRDFSDKEPSYIKAAFDMALDHAKASPESRNAAQIAALSKDGAKPVTDAEQPAQDAYAKYKASLTKPTREV